MTISLYDASVPVFKQMMRTLSIILDKAAKSENIAQELLSARLFPDMYDLTRQVQMSSDFDQSGFGAFGRYGDSLLPGQRNDLRRTATANRQNDPVSVEHSS